MVFIVFKVKCGQTGNTQMHVVFLLDRGQGMGSGAPNEQVLKNAPKSLLYVP
jgi:hypothetical protein